MRGSAVSVNVSGETVVIEPAIVDTDVLIDIGRGVEEAVASTKNGRSRENEVYVSHNRGDQQAFVIVRDRHSHCITSQ